MQIMACNAKSHRCYHANLDAAATVTKTKNIRSGAAVDALVCNPPFVVTGLQDTITDGARDAQACMELSQVESACRRGAAGGERATSKMQSALTQS